jgi:DNA-binding beta-propeller fold protein YncE
VFFTSNFRVWVPTVHRFLKHSDVLQTDAKLIQQPALARLATTGVAPAQPFQLFVSFGHSLHVHPFGFGCLFPVRQRMLVQPFFDPPLVSFILRQLAWAASPILSVALALSFGNLGRWQACEEIVQVQPIKPREMKANTLKWTCGIALSAVALVSFAQVAPITKPYRVVKTTQTMGTGGIDYVYADNDNRRLYVPRGSQVLVFDLDSLKSVGSITNARARGVAVDPKSQHGFCSSSPVVMWDAKTLETLKTIEVQGRPDGILFEPETERIYVFSHSQPNATVIEGKDGSVVGTIDLGGAPEQAASDGQGHLYVDIEDKDNVAVVDVKTLKVTAHYELGGKGGGPAGLGLDAKNHILFAMCHDPQTCVVLSADDGKILASLPIGRGTDGGGFNPNTMEAFSSQGDGTLTIIKERSPASFEVEQTVQTKPRAKTCTLDSKNGQIVLIAIEPAPASVAATTPTANASDSQASTTPAAGGDQSQGRKKGGGGGPGLLDILVVGR